MIQPSISLEQWRALVAVVEAGGYAQASASLHKTQSSITYAVQKIESLLEIEVFKIQGRKAVLTDTGEMVYRRAKSLLEEARNLEHATKQVSAGWEAELAIAVEILFPTSIILETLNEFGKTSPHTRIEVIESVLGGTQDALTQGKADIAIAPFFPQGFTGRHLTRLLLQPVAHPEHPLHHIKHQLTQHDLRLHRHLVIRDSGTQRKNSKTTIETHQRWTFSHIESSIEAATKGYGFAWLPCARIQQELKAGLLRPLPLQGGNERWVDLYTIMADSPDGACPGLKALVETIHRNVLKHPLLHYSSTEN